MFEKVRLMNDFVTLNYRKGFLTEGTIAYAANAAAIIITRSKLTVSVQASKIWPLWLVVLALVVSFKSLYWTFEVIFFALVARIKTI